MDERCPPTHSRRLIEASARVRDIMTRDAINAGPAPSWAPGVDARRLLQRHSVPERELPRGVVNEFDLWRRYELGTHRSVSTQPMVAGPFDVDDAPWSYVEAHAMKGLLHAVSSANSGTLVIVDVPDERKR
jgi:hypothetical protein